jgi:hypothetical protein
VPPWLVGPDAPPTHGDVSARCRALFKLLLQDPLLMPRRFEPPWTVGRIAGGYVVKDATGPKQRP